MGYKEDLQRVHAKIDGVATQLSNVPVRTPPNWWQRAATIIALCAFGLAFYTHHSLDVKNDVKIEATDQLKEPLKQIGEIAGDVKEIKGKLEVLDPLIRELTIKRLSEVGNLNSKDLVARLPELRHLATIAKTESVTVKPETVEKVGKTLIAVGTPDTWSAAIDFLNYKSFLNVSLSVAVKSVVGTGDLITQYDITAPSGLTPAKLRVAGAVPREQAAKILRIGQTDPNTSTPLGNDWIIAENGAFTLDNMQLKKVIFRNVLIEYSGGPLQMQDVYFLNCTFVVHQQPNGERLVAAVLERPPAVNFTAS